MTLKRKGRSQVWIIVRYQIWISKCEKNFLHKPFPNFRSTAGRWFFYEYGGMKNPVKKKRF